MNDESLRSDFFRRAIRRRWYVILVALLVSAGAVPAYLATTTTEYRATSVVFLEPLVGNPYSPTTLSGRQEQLAALTTEAGLVLSDSVARAAEEAGDAAGVDLGPRIQERTFTEVPSNSQVVNVSFTASTPEAAQFGAQALASSYLDYRQSRSEEVAATQLARLDQEIDSLSTLVDSASSTLDAAQTPDATSEPADVLRLQEQLRIYANQYGQLRIERVSVESASTFPGEVVSPAQIPSRPEGFSAPLIATAMVLSLLGCGLVAAVVLEHLDTRLRSADEIQSLGLTPVYGRAPLWHPELRGTTAEDPYRLATLSSQSGTLGLLGTSGPVPLEVTAGLAHTLADSGHSVTVILANPYAAQPDTELGLSDALDPDGSVRDLQTQYFESGIRVLTTGTSPTELSRLMHRPAFTLLVDSLAARSDVVLLAGGPTWSAPGAAIARVSRRAILVARAGETRGDDLLTAARLVEGCDAQLGAVFLTERPARKWLRRFWQRPKINALSTLFGRARVDVSATRAPAEDASSTLAAAPRRNGGS